MLLKLICLTDIDESFVASIAWNYIKISMQNTYYRTLLSFHFSALSPLKGATMLLFFIILNVHIPLNPFDVIA